MTPSTLEVLYAAKARLENKRTHFSFRNWASCTCGHIYAADYGRRARGWLAVESPSSRSRYADHIMMVARALGWDGAIADGYTSAAHSAVWFVSDYTGGLADGDAPDRSHAIATIDKAIAAIEAQQEQDRLAVLAQVKAIVDSAPVPEPVPVA